MSMNASYVNDITPFDRRGSLVDSLGDGNCRSVKSVDSDALSAPGAATRSPVADMWAESVADRQKFKDHPWGLTEVEHQRNVQAFLAGDRPNPEGDCPLPPYPNGTPRVPGCGKITRLDRGTSSGLACLVQKSSIRFGKNQQPFRRDQ